MTYDDGILNICRIKNVAQKGDKPESELIYHGTYYFSYEDLGINRYYTALANKEMIECVVAIPYDRLIRVNDVVCMEKRDIYKIKMVQHPLDNDNLRYTRLSLERINDDRFDTKTEVCKRCVKCNRR